MQHKYLTEDEIKRELDDYILNVKIKYATLLNGSWGSGKTYFIKNYIGVLEQKYEEHKKENDGLYKKPIYISLYGLNTISEIKNKILVSLIKNEKIKQIMPLLDVGLELGNEFVANKTFIQNSSSKLNKVIGIFHKVDNLIIVFDDLERCNIAINSILGYINELVEHNNIKVILVADESKIGNLNYDLNLELKYMVALSKNIKIENNKDNNAFNNYDRNIQNKFLLTKTELDERRKNIFNEDKLYTEVKEKLIGKTIYYRSDINIIYEKFVKKIIIIPEAENTVLINKEHFLELLEENNHYNLRTVQFILQSFNRLVSETIDIIDFGQIKSIYLNDLFSYCTTKSLRIKQGLNSYNWDDGQEFGTIYLGTDLDYLSKNFVVGFRFVDDYLVDSYIDKTKLKDILEDYKRMTFNEINNPNDPLYRLKTWWIIPEKEIEIIIDELIENIEKNNYDLELYSKIVSYLSRIEEMDVCKKKIDLAIKKMEDNISNGIVKGKYYEDRLFDGNAETVKLYRKNLEKIKILINKKQESDLQKTIDYAFDSENWGKKLKEYCKTNNSKFFNEKKFAYVLNVDKIIQNIKDKSIEEIYQFWYCLQHIYNHSDIKAYYENDKNELIKLKTELCSIKEIDKVKKFVVDKISDFLEQVIAKL